jgi:hypothetical protein
MMRGFAGLTKKESEDILKLHSTPYDGYAVGNVNTNMYPISVYDDVRDSKGITVTNKNDVKTYTNHQINEITAKPLNYDEKWDAYDFDSQGPQASMTQPNPGKKPYEFDSKGPSDVYENDFMSLDDAEEFVSKIEFEDEDDSINESVEKTLDLFKRFKNFN